MPGFGAVIADFASAIYFVIYALFILWHRRRVTVARSAVNGRWLRVWLGRPAGVDVGGSCGQPGSVGRKCGSLRCGGC